MSVIQELALSGAMVQLGALLSHPLTLALLSVGLSLYVVARRQDRARRAALAEAARCRPSQSPALRSRATARSLAQQQASPLPHRQATGAPVLDLTDGRSGFAPASAAFSAGLAQGLPFLGTSDPALAQVSLRTSRSYRLISLACAVLSPALAFGLAQNAAENGALLGILGFGASLFALWHAAWVMLWRMDYDSIGLSSCNRLFQPEARMWRALTGISSDGPFVTLFHFADGMVMRLPNFVPGRRQMMRTAQSWLQHGHAPDRP